MAAPAREYFYTIDASGRLWHDGTELTDARFLNFFYKRLGPNETGAHPDFPFLSPCGLELNFVRAESWPLVFRRLREGQLEYAPDLVVGFQPSGMRFTVPGGRLIHPAPVGRYGAFSRELTLEISRDIVTHPEGYLLSYGGSEFIVRPLAEEAGT